MTHVLHPSITENHFICNSMMSASNCSNGPNYRPQLFAKPFMSRFIGESRTHSSTAV